MFFKHQLFLAGLCDDLRMKVMEAGKDSLHESMRLAQELEIIHHKKHHYQAIAAIGTKLTPVEKEEEKN